MWDANWSKLGLQRKCATPSLAATAYANTIRCVRIHLTDSALPLPYMSSTEGKLLAAFSMIAFAMLVPPFVYHFKNRNIPACSLIFWLSFSNLTGFINAIIWSGDNFNEAPTAKGYCDITVRITSASPAGKLAAIAALIFNLYMIIAAKHHRFLAKDSKRRLITNWAMCWATPIFIMSTSIIVQAYRFTIVRYRGCVGVYSTSFVTLLLMNLWEVVWAFVAVFFALLTVFTYLRKRKDIKDILRCTNSGLNLRRFARLLIFSMLIVFGLAPYTIYKFVDDISVFGVSGFKWSNIHGSDWSTIYFADLGFTSQMVSRFLEIALSACTFLLFGMGTEALEMYRRFLVSIGLTYFRKSAKNDNGISKEFTGSRNESRKTVESEETATSMDEFAKFKELVFEEPFSIHLTATLKKSPTDDYDNNSEFCSRNDLEGRLELNFEFQVKHK